MTRSSNYIIEMIPQGRYMRVTAVDPNTGREVVMMGDAAQSRETLARLAVRKLEYVLAGKK